MRLRRAFLASGFVLLAGLAQADGLYLNLKSETERVPAGQPARVRLTATATRSFELPATPEFVVEGGSAAPEVRALDASGPVRVTADKALKAGYEVVLARPGTYRLRARYRLNGQVVDSNKITVAVE